MDVVGLASSTPAHAVRRSVSSEGPADGDGWLPEAAAAGAAAVVSAGDGPADDIHDQGWTGLLNVPGLPYETVHQ